MLPLILFFEHSAKEFQNRLSVMRMDPDSIGETKSGRSFIIIKITCFCISLFYDCQIRLLSHCLNL